MGLEILQLGGFLDGDETLVAAPATYVGGQGAMITATGVDLAAAGDATTVVGFFKNDIADDQATAPQVDDTAQTSQQQATIVVGVNKIRLVASGPTGTDKPYATPPTTGGTWLVGQELFHDDAATGLWDNVAANAGDPAYGKVIAVEGAAADPDALVVYQYGIKDSIS